MLASAAHTLAATKGSGPKQGMHCVCLHCTQAMASMPTLKTRLAGTGIKHAQDPHTGHVHTPQNHYVAEVGAVVVPHIDMPRLEADVDLTTQPSGG